MHGVESAYDALPWEPYGEGVWGQVDVRPLLPRVAVPLLYLQATGDRLVWPRCGRELVAEVPHGELRRIEGAHTLLQTAPRACWAAITGFAARLDDRAGGAATRLT